MKTTKKSDKPSSDKASSDTTTTTSSMMVTEDFPRGGANVLTPSELKAIRDEARDELLFNDNMEVEEEGQVKKTVKKQPTSTKQTQKPSSQPQSKVNTKVNKSNGQKNYPVISEPEPEKVSVLEPLSFKKLSAGTLLLGAVKEVGNLDLLISLTNGHFGRVSIADISDHLTKKIEELASKEQDKDDEDDEDEEKEEEEDANENALPDLTEMFHVGQLLQCVITLIEEKESDKDQKSSKHKINLSINPRLVNKSLTSESVPINSVLPATIESIEDHGYVVSFGVSSFKGFLPKENAKSYLTANNKQELTVGEFVQCVAISSRKSSGVITVSIDPTLVVSATINNSPSLDAILPLMKVECTVKQVAFNGITVKFGGFSGNIDLSHLQENLSELFEQEQKRIHEILSTHYPVNKKLAARILYVNKATKSIGLTLRPDILDLKLNISKELSVGDIVERAQVINANQNFGVTFKLPVGNHLGFALTYRLSDDKVETIGKQFKIGSKHKSRVVGYSLLDNLFFLSLQESILKLPFLKIENVKPGSVVVGTVTDVNKFGVTVQLTENIRGFISLFHISDVSLSKVPKHVSVGSSVECRVLHVKLDKHAVYLTHKKTLVKSTLSIITSKEDCQPGTLAHGYIAEVKSNGCIVAYYNHVYAFIPKFGLSSNESIPDPTKFFKRGQVMKTRILKYNKESNQVIATFKWNEPTAFPSSESEVFGANIAVGSLVTGTVSSFDESGLRVTIIDSDGKNGTFSIPPFHLTDYVAHEKQLLRLYSQKGLVLKNILVVDKPTVNRFELSLKPSLIASLNSSNTNTNKSAPVSATSAITLPSFDTIVVGQVLTGFVRSVLAYGVFVGFVNGVSGLAHVTNLSKKFVQNPAEFFSVGQSVKAVVTEYSRESKRINLSLSDSNCFTPSIYSGYISSFFLEEDIITNHLTQFGKPHETSLAVPATKQKLVDIAKSRVVTGTVLQVKSTGAVVDLGEGVNGWIAKEQFENNTKPKINASVECAVLDIDPSRCTVDLSLKPEFITNAKDEAAVANSLTSLKSLLSSSNSKGKGATTATNTTISVKATIELLKENYAVSSCPTYPGVFIYTALKNYNSQFYSDDRYQVGNTVSIFISKLGEAKLGTSENEKKSQKGKNAKTVSTENTSATLNNFLSKFYDLRTLGFINDAPTTTTTTTTTTSASTSSAAVETKKGKKTVDLHNSFTTLEEVKVGTLVTGKVISVEGMKMNIDLGNHVYGRVHITELLDDSKSETPVKNPTPATENGEFKYVTASDREHPLSAFKKGSYIRAKVIGFYEGKTHSWLPISHTVGGLKKFVDLTMKPSKLAANAKLESLSSKTVTQGQVVDGYILKVNPDNVLVAVSPILSVRVNDIEATSEFRILSTIEPSEPKYLLNDESEEAAEEEEEEEEEQEEGEEDDNEEGENGVIALPKVSKKVTKPASSSVSHGLRNFFHYKAYVQVRILAVNRHKKSAEGTLRINENRSISGLTVGAKLAAKVIEIQPQTGLIVKLAHSLFGKVALTDTADSYSENLFDLFTIGKFVQAVVVDVDESQGRVDVSLRESKLKTLSKKQLKALRDPEIASVSSVTTGQVLRGFVKNISESGCFVQLGRKVVGKALISNLSDSFLPNWKTLFPVGKLVTAAVLSVNTKSQQIELSFRNSDINPSTYKRPLLLSQISEGLKLTGVVTGCESYGVFVKLDNSNVCGLVYRTELSDHEPPKKFNTIFQTGDKVKVLVTKVEKEKKRVLLSMKPSHFDLDEEDEDNEEEGATTHNSVLQQKLKQLLELQQEEKQKRNARTADEVEEGEKDEEEEAEETTKEEKRSAKKARVEEATPKKGVKRSAQEEEEEEEDNAEEEEDEEDEKHQTPSLNSSTLSFEHVDVDDEITFKTPKKKTRVEADSTSTKSTKTPTSTTTSAKSSAVVHNLPSVNAPALQVSAGFGFDAAFNSLTSEAHSRNNDDDDDDDDGESYAKEIGDDDDDDEDNEDNEDGDSKSKQRRLTKSAKKEEEKRIAQAEKELLAKDTNTPESVEDFERLVLASPNSSYAWIKFMAFYLSSSEVDKARNVGEQALKIISYREERERLNIWIALLNLENKFGTAETLKQTLARALANADPKKVYFQLASIYEMTPGRRLATDELYKTMCSKFKESKKVWITYGTFKFKNSDAEAARALLVRGLKSLPKRKHLHTIIKFAQLEFRYGEIERGRTIFEKTLSEYPKRFDLWSVYLDMELRNKDIGVTRRLFDRVTSINMSTKKMKYFLKRFMEFEKQNGTKETVTAVKLKAQAYLQSKIA